MKSDPITLEIIQNALQAAADEMFAAMRKTAMSSIIYEVLDMGTGHHRRRGATGVIGRGHPGLCWRARQVGEVHPVKAREDPAPAMSSSPTILGTVASRT